MAGKFRHILVELKGHSPFTALGTILGICFMLLFRNASGSGVHTLFATFHPLHVLLSAVVSSSMFRLHGLKKNFLLVFIVAYLSSVGTATLSDIVIPHIGTNLLGLDVPSESDVHTALESGGKKETSAIEMDEHGRHKIHLGFIHEWYLVNPAAILGIIIGFLLPHTKFPHAGHILISTWASASYLLMDIESKMNISAALGVLATLFLAVLIPCVMSDIVFPLLFVKSDVEMTGPCPEHSLHSHPHTHGDKEQCQ
jgi:hypothetical protein